MAGKKQTDGKLPFHLLSGPALAGIAKVLNFGMHGKPDPYPARNWEEGLSYGAVFQALQRHLWKWWSGHTHDEESGLNHIYHVACLAMFLAHFESCPSRYNVDFDDRPIGHEEGISNEQFMATPKFDVEGLIKVLEENDPALADIIKKATGHE